MGIVCDAIGRYKLDADQILANINQLFQGMLIRSSDIDQIKERVKQRLVSKQAMDIEGWKNFINEEIYNSQFGQTTKALVTSAMQDAKANYNDQTLPLLCLLFLAKSAPVAMAILESSAFSIGFMKNAGTSLASMALSILSKGPKASFSFW